MRAMVITRLGGPDEVLVWVIASGTNPVDAKIRQVGTWAQIPFPAVLGYDMSGVIEALGPGVAEFKVGDEGFYTPEIFGNRHGSYAEYTIASASIVAPKPANLSHVEAAGIPLAGGTAWEALVRRLNVRLGETVLIHGGAGGVGSFAIQVAKAAGARVIATARKVNNSALQELGADVAVDYRDADVAERTLKPQADTASMRRSIQRAEMSLSTLVTRPFGRIATILPPDGDLSALYTKNQTLFGTFLTREGARLRELTPVFEHGQAKVVIDTVLRLEEVGNAHERLDSGHGRGKVILQVEH